MCDAAYCSASGFVGLYGTRIEVVTHCWLVSLEGACGIERVQLYAGYPGGFLVVLPVLIFVGLGCHVLADVEGRRFSVEIETWLLVCDVQLCCIFFFFTLQYPSWLLLLLLLLADVAPIDAVWITACGLQSVVAVALGITGSGECI